MPQPAWYYETAHPLGHWMPVKGADHPRITTHAGVQRAGDGTAPRVRAISLIHPDHLPLTLEELAQVYGPDGRFQAMRPTLQDLRAAWGHQAEDSGNS